MAAKSRSLERVAQRSHLACSRVCGSKLASFSHTIALGSSHTPSATAATVTLLSSLDRLRCRQLQLQLGVQEPVRLAVPGMGTSVRMPLDPSLRAQRATQHRSNRRQLWSAGSTETKACGQRKLVGYCVRRVIALSTTDFSSGTGISMKMLNRESRLSECMRRHDFDPRGCSVF